MFDDPQSMNLLITSRFFYKTQGMTLWPNNKPVMEVDIY